MNRNCNMCIKVQSSMNIQQLRLSAGPKIALHTHFVPFSSQNQINKISQIVFDKFPLTLLCLPIMASCTEGGCKIYLISTLIHGTMHIIQYNALNHNVLFEMDIFPNGSVNNIRANHITWVTFSTSFFKDQLFRLQPTEVPYSSLWWLSDCWPNVILLWQHVIRHRGPQTKFDTFFRGSALNLD